ncbi:LuxR C-terminal-related transcriptional regulator [Gordonia sp. VNK1]|uniref:LuxR C-terminal-related transcriptional regulator n=1 Tax=Gordonia oleivorans TaxID=3156618 RepID=UPI0032B4B947
MSPPPVWQPVPWYLTRTPRSRSDTIPRRRLSCRLDELVKSHRVVVVDAPSGYGKTVAVADWARRSPLAVAWLAMPARESDPSEFLRGLISAVCQLSATRGHHAALTALHTAHGPTTTAIGDFAMMIDRLGQPIVIVVDDAQRAVDALNHPAVAALIEHGPDSLRLVLSGHRELARSLNRQVVDGSCAVMDARELAFSVTETEAACADTPHDPRAVWDRTRGWPIAVHLAIVGNEIVGNEIAGNDNHLTTLTEDLGHNALLTDYVADEILAPLPSGLRDFILATTTTSQFDVALAARLTGHTDVAAMVDECVRRGLFLGAVSHPENPGESVYRWHSLFVAHCRAILARTDPDRARKLRLTAADHLRHTLPLVATELALAADDCGQALEILRDGWIGLVISSAATPTEGVATALSQRIDDPDRSCELAYIRAACREVRGDRLGARFLFAEAERLLGDDPGPVTKLTRAACTFFLADEHVQIADAHDVTMSVLADPEAAHELAPAMRASCAFLAGWIGTRLRLDADRGVALLRTAIEECRSAGLTDMARRAEANYGSALSFAGRFRELAAFRGSADAPLADSSVEWDHFDEGITAFTLGWAEFWTGDLPAALPHLRAGAELDSMHGYWALLKVYRALTATILGDGAELSAAEVRLRSVADEYLHGVPWPVYVRLARARIAECTGDHETVRRLASEIEDAPAVPAARALFSGMLRRVGDPVSAHRMLAGLELPGSPIYAHVYANLTAAILAWQTGDREAAHDRLEHALQFARPEGAILPFLDNLDGPANELLTAHAFHGRSPAFLATIASRRNELLDNTSGLSVTLTRREREVLDHLQTSMSIKEIADSLFVSTNTLKTHCRTIYRKLGVSSRRDAVRYATSMRL